MFFAKVIVKICLISYNLSEKIDPSPAHSSFHWKKGWGTHTVRLTLFPKSITSYKKKALVIAARHDVIVDLSGPGKKGFPPEQDSENVADNCFSWLAWLVMHQVGLGKWYKIRGKNQRERGKTCGFGVLHCHLRPWFWLWPWVSMS